MLEYGINFNTKDGAAKAQKELEALHKRWQKIFDEAPLTVKFSKIDFDKLVRSGSMNKIAKDAQSIGEQIRKMRAEFRGLTVDEARAGAGSNIIERYRKLKAEAGIYAGTLDQAVKAQDRLAAESDKATGAIRRQNREFKKQSEVLTQLKSYAMNFLSVYAGIRMIKNLATITGEFEMQKTSIQAILQDAEKGAAIFERIKKLAVISPFQFKDLISYTKQLSAFSVPYEELYNTTKMLADLSAGLGVSMERLILAYGQVRSAAVLRGQELRQFTEAGIPIVEELRQKLSEANGELVTTGEVFDYISARKVPFEMVRDILVEMASEGGKFYKMQEVQAETLKGKIANLTDAFQIMLANIGEKDGGLMKGAVDGIRALIENYETVGGILGTLVATYGAYKASLIAANTAELIMNGTYVAKIRILRAAVVAQRALNAAMMVNPYVLLATAVTGLATAFVLLRDKTTAAEKAQKRFNDTLAETQELADKERAKITELVNAVKDETRTRRDRQLKIEELQRLYPDIFANLDLETAKNFELAKAIGEVNKELEAKSDAQMQERVVEITKELTRLRYEHGTTAYAGMYKYTIDHAERINELESERALITGKIAENAAAAAAAANQTLSEWQKMVDSFVKANDASFLKYSGEDGTVYSYINRIRDEYKRLTDEYSTYSTLVDSGSKKQAQRLKEQIALTEQLAKTMGFSLGGGKDPNIEQNAMIKAAERLSELRAKMALEEKRYALEVRQADIESTKEGAAYKIAMMELERDKELLSIEERKQAMINANRDIARAKWESEGGKGVFSSDVQLTKEQEELIAALRKGANDKYLANDKAVREEIISRYRDYSLQKLAIEEQLSRDIADIETQRAKDGNEITERRIREAKKIANKGISDIQKDILSKYGLDGFFSDGDMSDFIKDKIKAALPLFKSISTATLGELKKIKDVLSEIEFPQELMDDFEAAGGDVLTLVNLISEAIKKGNKAVDERIIDKLIKRVNKMVGSLGELASALEDTSDSFLSSIGRFMSGIASGLGDITELIKLGDKATFADQMSAGLSGLATIVSTVSSHIKANAEAQKEWNDALMESEQRMRMFRIEQEAYKDGIFGMGSPIAPAVAGVKQYMAAMEELSKITVELGEGLVQVGSQKVPSDSAFAGFVMGGAGIGAAVGSIIPGLGTAIGAVVGGLFGGVIAGISSLFGSKASTKLVPVFKKLKDQYAWLYNEGFELNPQIIADYEKLDDATKEIVDNWEEIQAKAKEAQEQIEETLANIAGSIGEDLYSALIEAFDNKDLDSAMNKFRNSVNRILSDFAGRMLFSAVFGDILDKGEERMKNSLGADGDQNLVDDIDWLGDRLEENIPAYLSGLESLSDMLSALGRTLGFSDEDTETNLKGISKGVSTITEDTALVLGGYLDSIRLKLFQYIDMMMADGLPFVSKMLLAQSQMVGYLASIDANTKRSANASANLAENIGKVMVAESDGWKLNVKV